MARTEESARVADAIRATMQELDLTRTELRDRIEAITGQRPTEMWLSRILTGDVHLTERIEVTTTEPVDSLKLIAQAIDPQHGEGLASTWGKAADPEADQYEGSF
jgi:hypothetical protein